MKKDEPSGELIYYSLKKTMLIMGIAIVLLITGILQAHARYDYVKYPIIDRKIILSPEYLTEVSQPQQNKITGIVIDKNGPIPGANVVITGTTQGTITDVAGKYSIEVPQGAKSLTFTFIGMQPQEISIGTLTQIDVTMAESAIGLDEVVVVGYGTQKRLNITGSVASISTKDVKSLPVANVSS